MQGIAEFNWMTAVIGGLLIGVSAALVLAFNGRIAGLTGIVNGAFTLKASEAWRWAFLVSVVLGGAAYQFLLVPRTEAPATPSQPPLLLVMLIGGFAVGFGTRMGNGCTSGHGVCGIGRLSVRSLVAVITFMTAGIVTVFVVRHLLGFTYF